jgi:hypothetical protein
MPEGLTLEFKREYTEELKKTIAAFAAPAPGVRVSRRYCAFILTRRL